MRARGSRHICSATKFSCSEPRITSLPRRVTFVVSDDERGRREVVSMQRLSGGLNNGPGSCRTGLKEPSAAPGSPKRGAPRARRHTKRAGLGTRRAKRRRKRTKPGTRGSQAPPKKSRVRRETTPRRDLASQAPVEKSRVWYWESRGRVFFVGYRPSATIGAGSLTAVRK